MIRVIVGESVRIRVAFTSEAGQPLAATGVTVEAKPPGAAPVAGAVVETAEAGVFHADFETTTPGTWIVKARCAGPSVAIVQGSFRVAEPAF